MGQRRLISTSGFSPLRAAVLARLPARHLSLVARHFLLFLLGALFLRVAAGAQNPPAPPATPPQAAAQPSEERQEAQALQDAVRYAEDNPQVVIKNLESFLDHFPASAHREQVIEAIYKSSFRANDPQTGIEYGEKLLAFRPDDPAVLSTLVELLERQGGAANYARALEHATHLVAIEEKQYQPPGPPGAGQAHGSGQSALMLAQACLLRGKLFADSGATDKAEADYNKSYAVYPSREVAERLGDLAVKKNDLERAVDEFATAFAFPGPGADPVQREQVRRKLGSCYLALHGSEKGLGDLVLARYDQLSLSLAPRFQDSGQPNTDLRDPFAFVLKRTDGSLLPLAGYRGKVVVLEFWATWCGPCRLEGSLLEQVTKAFRNEPGVVFLAVNVDENRERVPAYIQQERWTTQVAYAQGLDRLLAVVSLPTLVIFDRGGRVVHRQEGLTVQTFVDTVEKKIRGALGQSVAAAAR